MLENMKKAREAAGLNQKQVALALHVSGATVSNWESGEISPKVDNLKALSELLGVSTDYLIGISDKPVLEPKKNMPSFGDTEEEGKLLIAFRLLNADGQREVLNYLEYILTKPEYKPVLPSKVPDQRRLALEKNRVEKSSPSSEDGSETA
ncbi:MAG: helix-turn-helix transcriptional regulator [Clostridiales bacterium]|nr:helix-turn-helix transcriptional regulator [Clostridiales bacterium]